jgi:signal transduction histidine kinase
MRTPLNAILGIGKNLESHIKTEVGKKYFRVIINSAKFMQSLVNDLIDLFRIRNGKFTSNEGRANLEENLTEVLEIFQLQASEKGLNIILEYDPNLPKVLTLDIQRIKQILTNLIGNALKFTFRGQITISSSVTFSFEGTPQL